MTFHNQYSFYLKLLLTIGKTSNDEVELADLSELPNLFLTYSEPKQMHLFFRNILSGFTQMYNSEKTEFAFAVSKETFRNLKSVLKGQRISFLFITNGINEPGIGSKRLFIKALTNELKRREKTANSVAASTVNLPPIVILVDDLFELIISNRKSTGLSFLKLLIRGKEYGIHFVMASIKAYRNLLSQLLIIHPEIQAELSKSYPELNNSISQPLGGELVITPEGLYFFRKRTEVDYKRFFPFKEIAKTSSLPST